LENTFAAGNSTSGNGRTTFGIATQPRSEIVSVSMNLSQ
jgi:hypothetical protein